MMKRMYRKRKASEARDADAVVHRCNYYKGVPGNLRVDSTEKVKKKKKKRRVYPKNRLSPRLEGACQHSKYNLPVAQQRNSRCPPSPPPLPHRATRRPYRICRGLAIDRRGLYAGKHQRAHTTLSVYSMLDLTAPSIGRLHVT